MAAEKKKWWTKILPASEGVFCLLAMALVVVVLVRTQPVADPAPIPTMQGNSVTGVITDRSASRESQEDLPAKVRVVSQTSVK